MTAAPSTLQIGLIASARQTSGSDRYYFELLRNLRTLGSRADGVVLGDPASLEDPLPDIASFAPEGSRALRRWRGLRRTVRQALEGHDVVVSHLAAHVFPVLDIVRTRPLVEHFHGPWALEARYAKLPARTVALRSLQEASVYHRAQRIIALSQSFARVLQMEYRIAERKIRIVPGAVDIATFTTDGTRDDARTRLELPLDRKIVVTARRLESTKGVDVLIEALALLVRENDDALLIVVGTGRLASVLERLVIERRLTAHVRFAGKVDDATLRLLYRAADVSIVPSQAWEGFGLVCLESLACGTPVLVTPVGGLPEAVAALEPALVLSGADVASLAAGLGDALTGRVPMPSQVRCRAYAERFAWPAIAQRVAEVYREVA